MPSIARSLTTFLLALLLSSPVECTWKSTALYWLYKSVDMWHPGLRRRYHGPPTYNGSNYAFPLRCNGSLPNLWLAPHYGSLYAMCARNDDKRISADCRCKRRQGQSDITICEKEEFLEPWYMMDPDKAKASFGGGIHNIKQYCGTWCHCPGQEGYEVVEKTPEPSTEFACPCNWTYISNACCFSDNGLVWESPDKQLPGTLEPPDDLDYDDDGWWNDTEYDNIDGGGGRRAKDRRKRRERNMFDGEV